MAQFIWEPSKQVDWSLTLSGGLADLRVSLAIFNAYICYRRRGLVSSWFQELP